MKSEASQIPFKVLAHILRDLMQQTFQGMCVCVTPSDANAIECIRLRGPFSKRQFKPERPCLCCSIFQYD